MKIKQLTENKGFFDRLQTDQRQLRLLAIAFNLDKTVPRIWIAKLGPDPSDKEIAKLVAEEFTKRLRETDYGNIDDGKFNEWAIRLYSGGGIDFEDLLGQLPDQLGAFRALSIRGKIPNEFNDINKFRSFKVLKSYLTKYNSDLEKIQNEAKLEQAKRDQRYITLIDDDRYLVQIPLNYGACYMFNMGEGVRGSFCTGSSSGLGYFKSYSSQGPLITILDKANMNDPFGKWQLHVETSQLQNAPQNWNDHWRNGSKFGELFPGLMKRIIRAIEANDSQITEKGREFNFNWKLDSTIERIKRSFNLALNDEPKSKEEPANT